MKKTLIGLVLLVSSIFAQDAQETWVVEPQQGSIHKNVIFCMDMSYSMKQNEVHDGINKIVALAESAVDELNITGIIFAEDIIHWSGPTIKNEKLPKEWAALPSKNNLDEFYSWLGNTSPQDTGYTRMFGAIEAAAKSQVDPITIVVVTDGVFTEFSNEEADDAANSFVKRINAINKSRCDAGLKPASFGFVLTNNQPEFIRKLYEEVCKSQGYFYLQLH